MSVEMASFGRAFLFLGVGFILIIFYLQWQWAKTCDKNIQILVAQRGGGGAYILAPKSGGEITIHNPETNEDRTWPINELATIDVLYPGLGFVPKFLQKSIRLAIVNEGDWEPMLNRSPHRKKIASPDVVMFLSSLKIDNPVSNEDSRINEAIDDFVSGLSTGPTREMIADPAVLGNLQRSGVLKALATVSNDLLEALKNINTRLTKFLSLNPTVVYVGLGLAVILSGVSIYMLRQIAMPAGDYSDMISKVDAIYNALGIKP